MYVVLHKENWYFELANESVRFCCINAENRIHEITIIQINSSHSIIIAFNVMYLGRFSEIDLLNESFKCAAFLQFLGCATFLFVLVWAALSQAHFSLGYLT